MFNINIKYQASFVTLTVSYISLFVEAYEIVVKFLILLV